MSAAPTHRYNTRYRSRYSTIHTILGRVSPDNQSKKIVYIATADNSSVAAKTRYTIETDDEEEYNIYSKNEFETFTKRLLDHCHILKNRREKINAIKFTIDYMIYNHKHLNKNLFDMVYIKIEEFTKQKEALTTEDYLYYKDKLDEIKLLSKFI